MPESGYNITNGIFSALTATMYIHYQSRGLIFQRTQTITVSTLQLGRDLCEVAK